MHAVIGPFMVSLYLGGFAYAGRRYRQADPGGPLIDALCVAFIWPILAIALAASYALQKLFGP